MTISATTQGIKPGVCTSTNRPSAPFDGQVIYMTDVDQTAVWDGTQWTVLAPIAGGRNLLINGDFKVWQRGNARTKLNAGSYLADRWGPILYQSGSYERVDGRATQYAMRVSSSSVAEDSNGTRMWSVQKVESLNSYRLRGQQVTLSFWVRFSAATCSSSTATAYGNWTADIGYYTSTTDSATGTTADDSGTTLTLTNGSLPTTWTKYTVTGTCPSNANNLHARFGFGGLGNTASNSGVWYEVAEVQLEAGAVATPFEFEDFGTTLAKCQRYFETQDWSINTWRLAVSYVSNSTANGYFTYQPKRVTPSFSWSGNGSARYIYNGGNAAGSQTLTAQYGSYNGSSFNTSGTFVSSTGWVDNAGTLSISSEL